VLSSAMHMAWVRGVAGRLKSDYSYAPSVYNNFPWPDPAAAQRARIETAGEAILLARKSESRATLAELYDSVSMPPDLARAHAKLDRAVDAAYGASRGFSTEAARLSFLFDLYKKLTSPLAPAPGRRAAKPRKRRV